MSLFQSNLRKQIKNLPKILNFVNIIQYFSKLFTSLLNRLPSNKQRRLGGLDTGGSNLRSNSFSEGGGSSSGCDYDEQNRDDDFLDGFSEASSQVFFQNRRTVLKCSQHSFEIYETISN